MSDHHLLRDPWALSLLLLMVVMWVHGFIVGYVTGWRMGDPFAVAWHWLKRRFSR